MGRTAEDRLDALCGLRVMLETPQAPVKGQGPKIKGVSDFVDRNCETIKPSPSLRLLQWMLCFVCTPYLFAHFTECKRQIPRK
jgi:hypothetical protein